MRRGRQARDHPASLALGDPWAAGEVSRSTLLPLQAMSLSVTRRLPRSRRGPLDRQRGGPTPVAAPKRMDRARNGRATGHRYVVPVVHELERSTVNGVDDSAW